MNVPVVDVQGMKWSTEFVNYVKSSTSEHPLMRYFKDFLDGTATYSDKSWPCGCKVETGTAYNGDLIFTVTGCREYVELEAE